MPEPKPSRPRPQRAPAKGPRAPPPTAAAKKGAKRDAAAPPATPARAITKAPRQGGKVPLESCGNCGHWSSGQAFGLDDRSGYCNHWERITNYDDTCPDFLTRQEYQEVQEQLAEESEDEMDEYE